MKKIFLTGATGFIGTNFLRYALEQGFHVIALTRNSKNKHSHDNLVWHKADLGAEQNWKKILDNVDIIVNIAGEVLDEDRMQMVNLDSPLKLLNAAIDAGVDRWVQLSSVGAYGPAYKGIIDENRSDNPIGRYEKTKSEFDVMLLEASKLSQIKVSIIRPSNVYGIGMTNDSIFKLFNSIRNGYFAFIGPVGASANYIHVKDVVQALGLCLEHPNAVNQIFIVSAWATIEKMVSGLIQETGIKFPSRRLSFALADWLSDKLKWIPNWPLTSSRVRALSMRCSYSTGKIEKELGWKLTMPVEEGMIQLNKHFK